MGFLITAFKIICLNSNHVVIYPYISEHVNIILNNLLYLMFEINKRNLSILESVHDICLLLQGLYRIKILLGVVFSSAVHFTIHKGNSQILNLIPHQNQ